MNAVYAVASEVARPFVSMAMAYRRSRTAGLPRQVLALAEPPRLPASYLLWVHGASIGETCSLLPLVRALLASDRGAAVLMTASTPGALARLAMEDLGPRVALRHRPHDCSSSIKPFLRHWRPHGLILAESELWPSLLTETRRAGVPVALANARLSARSLARWTTYAPAMLRRMLECCSVVLAQTPEMARTLQQQLDAPIDGNGGAVWTGNAPAGLGGARVLFCGDLKQIRQSPNRSPASVECEQELKRVLGDRLRSGSVWLAASTHAGEEASVLRVHAEMRRKRFHDLLLILVPRHPERGRSIAAVAAEVVGGDGDGAASTSSSATSGGDPAVARRSVGDAVASSTSVYVCDTLGELPTIYGLVDVAFVGGSLVPLGGHSLLEAAQSDGGCAVLHGPHVEAVRDAAAALAAASPPAALCVRDEDELQREIELLLADDDRRRASGAAAARTAHALEDGVLQRVWTELEGPLGLPPLRVEGAVASGNT